MNARRYTTRPNWRTILALALAPVACGDPATSVDFATTAQLGCSIPNSEIFSGGVGKDGIPALTNPDMVAPNEPGADYLLLDDRVIGLVIGAQAFAIPLNIMWWHEIVNLDVGGLKVAVSHCPLTGSSLAFDRASVGGAEFGVSGLLFQNNLIMYDRNTQESLWPQMTRGARCGVRSGDELDMVPVLEMSWLGWQALYPQTLVVSSETEFPRNYQNYPYGDYDRLDNQRLLFPLRAINPQRLPKERVLGIPNGDGGRAYPFGALDSLGSTAVVEGDGDVIFWDRPRQAAMAFSRVLDGIALDFQVVEGQIRDTQTESVWQVDGRSISGLLAGRRLAAVPEAYVSYWFAWAAFFPNATLWRAP